MTFLPVVERELRAASRRRQTYWRRSLTGLVTIGICVWVWFTFSGGAVQHERAQALFYTISGLTFAYSLLAGTGATADCLSEEKRDGTLGLLFLTDLKGYDVVLGKLTATSVDSFYRLMAVFPVLAIPLLMGGLTIGEFWRMVLVLVNTLFFSLAAGVFVSSISQQSQKAISGAFGLILLVAGGIPAAGLVFQAWQAQPKYPHEFLLGTPGYAYALVFDASYKLRGQQFWICLALTHALTWILLGWASLILPRSWQDRPATSAAAGWRERLYHWRFGQGRARHRFRTRLLEINPFFWLASRDQRKPHYVLALLAVCALVWLSLYWRFPSEMLDAVTLVLIAMLVHTILKFWIASESCRQIAEDRRTGALELFLSTPVSIPEILHGQLLALNRQFFKPVAAVLIVDIAMFTSRMRDVTGSGEWPLLFVTVMAVFIADLYTLAWLGMWLGLSMKTAHRAASAALVRVLVLPWIGYVALMTMLVFLRPSPPIDSETFLIGAWLVVSMLNNLYFYTSARRNLLEQFRLVATQRFDSGKTGPAPDSEIAQNVVAPALAAPQGLASGK